MQKRSNLYLCLFLKSVLIQAIFAEINWQQGAGGVEWAHACDFDNHDLSSAQVPGEQCGEKCISTSGCSHFSWTNYEGGTCWMKTGGAQKSDAKFNNDDQTVCGIVPSSNTEPNPAGNRRFTIKNRCSWTVWPGLFGRNSNPFKGGFQLNPGETKIVDVPHNWHSARIWPRTGCRTQGGNFQCDTGQCKNNIQCDGSTGRTPVTLAEFNLASPQGDWYDISLVDGFSIPMSIEPTSGACKKLYCKKDINQVCPSEFQYKNSQGKVVGCYTSCEKYKSNDQCCKGPNSTPQTCPQGNIKTYWLFKNQCPDAYAYAYDDKTSLIRCSDTSTNYNIFFC